MVVGLIMRSKHCIFLVPAIPPCFDSGWLTHKCISSFSFDTTLLFSIGNFTVLMHEPQLLLFTLMERFVKLII